MATWTALANANKVRFHSTRCRERMRYSLRDGRNECCQPVWGISQYVISIPSAATCLANKVRCPSIQRPKLPNRHVDSDCAAIDCCSLVASRLLRGT